MALIISEKNKDIELCVFTNLYDFFCLEHDFQTVIGGFEGMGER